VEMMLGRLAHRLQVREATIGHRLRELQRQRTTPRSPRVVPDATLRQDEQIPQPTARRAARHEVELLEVLLADPKLLPQVREALPAEEVEHPGLQRLYVELLRLEAEGLPVALDLLADRLDNELLWRKATELQDRGLDYPDRPGLLTAVLARFAQQRQKRHNAAIQYHVRDLTDHGSAREHLARLRSRSS
jgi:hypothetical protein